MIASLTDDALDGRNAAPSERRRRWLGTRLYWLCQFVGWLGMVGWTIGFSYSLTGRMDHDRNVMLLGVVVAGILATHLLRVVLLLLRERRSGTLILIGLPVALPLVAMAMAGPLSQLRSRQIMAAPNLHAQLAHFTYLDVLGGQLVPLLGWTAVYFAFVYYRGYRQSLVEKLQLEAAVKEAELRVLKTQINPHFLFNCLNSIWAMIPPEQERPREALTLLADLLRAALSLGERTTVSFRQEWQTVQTYLALEQIRFEHRLRVRYDIESAAEPWPVPPFVVQTLVENAVKFGIRPRDEGGEIAVEAGVRNASLHVRVTNPGRLASPRESTGVGLKNSRARLRHLFGDRATLTLTQTTEDSVVAELSIHTPADPVGNSHAA